MKIMRRGLFVNVLSKYFLDTSVVAVSFLVMADLEGAPIGHPIRLVADRTGLSPEVIRAWERRHGAVTPTRSAGGQRRYSDEQVERLRLLAAAVQEGRGIGQLATLSLAQLASLVAGDARAGSRSPSDGRRTLPSPGGALVTRALGLTAKLDGDGLSDLLRRAAAARGVSAFIDSVVAPLLWRVGAAWESGRLTPAQEHLASCTVREVVSDAVRSLAAPVSAPRVLLSTLAGERHELGAMLAGATAAVSGWRVVYLGPDLPAEVIAAAARVARARVVGISMVYVEDRAGTIGEMRALRDALPTGIALLAGGEGASRLSPELRSSGIQVVSELRALSGDLARLSA